MGVLHGDTWRMLRVPDIWLGGQNHPRCLGWLCLTQRKIFWKFRVNIFIRSVSRRGVLYSGSWWISSLEVCQEGLVLYSGTWRILKFPERVILDIMDILGTSIHYLHTPTILRVKFLCNGICTQSFLNSRWYFFLVRHSLPWLGQIP